MQATVFPVRGANAETVPIQQAAQENPTMRMNRICAVAMEKMHELRDFQIVVRDSLFFFSLAFYAFSNYYPESRPFLVLAPALIGICGVNIGFSIPIESNFLEVEKITNTMISNASKNAQLLKLKKIAEYKFAIFGLMAGIEAGLHYYGIGAAALEGSTEKLYCKFVLGLFEGYFLGKVAVAHQISKAYQI